MARGVEIPTGIVDPACPINCHPLNRGLVAWWNAVPNSGWSGGSTFRDAVRGRKTNDGTKNSGVTWASGRRAVKFNGSSGFITCPNSVNLNVAGANASFSVVVWFRWTGNGGTEFVALIDKGTGVNSRPFQLFFFGGGFSTFRFQQYDGSTNPYADASSLYADGVWHQAVGVRDCVNSQMRIYVDGKDVTSGGSNVGFSTNFNDTGTVDFGNNRNGLTGYYNGETGQSQIFGRALNSSQIKQLFHEQRRGNPNTLNWVSTKTIFIPDTSGGSSVSRTLADAPSTSDTLARTVIVSRAITGAPATSDALTRAFAGVRTLAGAPSTSDALTRIQGSARAMTGAPATSDALTRTQVISRAIADSPSTADALARTGAFGRTLADAPNTSDALSAIKSIARSLSDTPSTADAFTRTGTFSRATPDTPVTSDALTRVVSAQRTLADTPSAADAFTRLFVGARTLTDAASISDELAHTIDGAASLSRTLADSPVTSDAFTRHFVGTRSLADAPSTADLLARVTTLPRTLADSPSSADALAKTTFSSRALADSPSVAGSMTRQFIGSRLMGDAAATADVMAAVGGATTTLPSFVLSWSGASIDATTWQGASIDAMTWQGASIDTKTW